MKFAAAVAQRERQPKVPATILGDHHHRYEQWGCRQSSRQPFAAGSISRPKRGGSLNMAAASSHVLPFLGVSSL